MTLYLLPVLLLSLIYYSIGYVIMNRITYLYSIFPEYFLLPYAITLSLLIPIFAKIVSNLVPISKQSNHLKFRKYSHHYIIPIFLVSLMISPVVISDIGSGGFLHEINKFQSSSNYISGNIVNASFELRKIRLEYNMNDSYDLWEPLNGGTVFQSGIIYEDPHALIFPAMNLNGFPTNNSMQNAYNYLYSALNCLINNDSDIGGVLSEINVGFIIVLTNVSYNSQYEKVFGSPYLGKPCVSTQLDSIIGNPNTLSSTMLHESSLQVISHTNQFIIFRNLDYKGIATSSSNLLSIPSSKVSYQSILQFQSLPVWNGSPPIVTTCKNFPSNISNNILPLKINNTSFADNFDGIDYLSPSYLLQESSGGISKGNVCHFVNLSNKILASPLNETMNSILYDFGGFTGNNLLFRNGTFSKLSSNYTAYVEKSLNDSFSLNVWINATSLAKEINGTYGYNFIFGNLRGFDLSTVNGFLDGTLTFNSNQSIAPAQLFYKIQPKTWYMVTLNYNGSVFSMDVNGTLVGSVNVTAIFYNDFQFEIGRAPFYHYIWDGYISQLMLNKYPLNNTTLAFLYRRGADFYDKNITGTVLLYPLTSTYIQNDSLSLKIPSDITTIVVGYSGSIKISWAGEPLNLNSSTESDGVIYSNVYLNATFTVSSIKAKIFYILCLGKGGTHLLQLVESKTINSVLLDGSSISLTGKNLKWVYTSNTFVPQMNTNIPTLHVATFNGASAVFVYNDNLTSFSISYQGISPFTYILVGIAGFFLISIFVFYLTSFIRKRK